MRHLVGTVSLPQALASRFTARQLKVVLIVNDECRMHGRCSLPLDAIAARAGVCRSTVQNTVREAQRLGLITLEERRPLCQPSLTNIVRIAPCSRAAAASDRTLHPIDLSFGLAFDCRAD